MKILPGWKTYLVAALGAAWDLVLADLTNNPTIGPYWPVIMIALRQVTTTKPGIRVLAWWRRLQSPPGA